MKIVNYTELRLNLKHWLNSVIDDVEEVIIKRKDQKDLVLISLEEYNSLVETNYLLTGKNRDVLLNSIKEASSGSKSVKKLIEE
jgi:antitoxin YefM